MEGKSRGQFWALCAILLASVAFGGGGSRYGLANLLVQLTALGALAFHRKAFLAFWATAPWPLRTLVAVTLLLPLLYIVPLPPAIWSAFPGRELVRQSLELAGGIGWATASVDPVRSLLAVTALITPLAILAAGWTISRDRLIMVGWLVVSLGLINLLIGVVQVLSNGSTGLFYPENPMPGVLFGTFANRNTTGLFLVGALSLAAFLPVPPRLARFALPARIAVCVLIVLAIVLTRSRTAIVLSLLPLGALILRAAAIQFGGLRKGNRAGSQGNWAALAAIALALGAAGSLAVTGPGRFGDVIERFDSDRTDARTYIWEDATYSAGRYWPIGAGPGSFDDVFQLDESLENMTRRRAGRAHNDYIEVAIETGLPGLALVFAWLAIVAWLSWRARGTPTRWIAWSGGLALVAIALQSITDYPLRSQTMLAFSAVAFLFLARFGPTPDEEIAEKKA